MLATIGVCHVQTLMANCDSFNAGTHDAPCQAVEGIDKAAVMPVGMQERMGSMALTCISSCQPQGLLASKAAFAQYRTPQQTTQFICSAEGLLDGSNFGIEQCTVCANICNKIPARPWLCSPPAPEPTQPEPVRLEHHRPWPVQQYDHHAVHAEQPGRE